MLSLYFSLCFPFCLSVCVVEFYCFVFNLFFTLLSKRSHHHLLFPSRRIFLCVSNHDMSLHSVLILLYPHSVSYHCYDSMNKWTWKFVHPIRFCLFSHFFLHNVYSYYASCFITGQTQISFWSPSFHSFFFPNIIFSYSILMKRYYCMFSISFLHRVGVKDLPTTWAWYLHMRQTSEFLFLISYLICIKNRLVVESLISITVSTSFLISTYS